MNRSWIAAGCVLAALLLFLVVANLPALPAAEPAQFAPSFTSTSAVAVPALSWWEKVYNNLESALRDNQKRMVQFCLVGMLLALWVIWWRK